MPAKRQAKQQEGSDEDFEMEEQDLESDDNSEMEFSLNGGEDADIKSRDDISMEPKDDAGSSYYDQSDADDDEYEYEEGDEEEEELRVEGDVLTTMFGDSPVDSDEEAAEQASDDPQGGLPGLYMQMSDLSKDQAEQCDPFFRRMMLRSNQCQRWWKQRPARDPSQPPFLVTHDQPRGCSIDRQVTTVYDIDGREISGWEMVLAIGFEANDDLAARVCIHVDQRPDRPLPLSLFLLVAPAGADQSEGVGDYVWTVEIDNDVGQDEEDAITVAAALVGQTMQSFYDRLQRYRSSPRGFNTKTRGILSKLDDYKLVPRILFDLTGLARLTSRPRMVSTALETLMICGAETYAASSGGNVNIADSYFKNAFTKSQLLSLWKGLHRALVDGQPMPNSSKLDGGIPENRRLGGYRAEWTLWLRTHIIGVDKFWPPDISIAALTRIIRSMSAIADSIEIPDFPRLPPNAFDLNLFGRPKLLGPAVRVILETKKEDRLKRDKWLARAPSILANEARRLKDFNFGEWLPVLKAAYKKPDNLYGRTFGAGGQGAAMARTRKRKMLSGPPKP